jgi:8-oxo-dGTP pyrophosphatase MutT (NUDIX family)
MPRIVQKFEVSLKAFVVRGKQALFVREADTGYWELPGGRIDAGEESAPHELILEREIGEELGPRFRIEIGTETVTWTRRRPLDGAFLFIVARMCKCRSGEIKLSHEHDDHAWMAADAWRNLRLPPQSGYETGVAELFRRHLASLAGIPPG